MNTPDKNQRNKRISRRDEDISGESGSRPDRYRDRDYAPHRKSYAPRLHSAARNENSVNEDPAKETANYRTYGSPYDVGNYASHYDRRDYNPGDQRIGSSEQIAGVDHRGKGPRGYQRSDKRILEDINDHLYVDPYIDASDIEVQVDKHEVILTGRVDDRTSKRRAEDIADSIPGVKNVENRIRVAKRHVPDPGKSDSGSTGSGDQTSV